MVLICNKHRRFKICKDDNGYILINKQGEYCQHAHLASLTACRNLIKWIDRKVMPKSSYLRVSVYRLVGDEADTFVDPIHGKRPLTVIA